MICVPVAATVGLFNDMRQYFNKHCLLPVLCTLSFSTCVHNMHVSPRYYTLPWTVLCITCLVCLGLNRWVHTRMSVSRKCVFAVWCLQMLKSTTYYHCISCSFPNNLTNIIIYPKTRFCLSLLLLLLS